MTFFVLRWLSEVKRGVAQLGSAPLWGSGGRGFKSRRSDLNTEPEPSDNGKFRFLVASLRLANR